MRPDVRDAALLFDMLVHARRTHSFVASRTFQDYLSSDLLRAAVERTVLVIGEAASKVSKPLREAHPQIPWSAIIVVRHILVHDYGRIDDDKIWRVATVHVPVLVQLIESLLPPPPPDPLPEVDT